MGWFRAYFRPCAGQCFREGSDERALCIKVQMDFLLPLRWCIVRALWGLMRARQCTMTVRATTKTVRHSHLNVLAPRSLSQNHAAESHLWVCSDMCHHFEGINCSCLWGCYTSSTILHYPKEYLLRYKIFYIPHHNHNDSPNPSDSKKPFHPRSISRQQDLVMCEHLKGKFKCGHSYHTIIRCPAAGNCRNIKYFEAQEPHTDVCTRCEHERERIEQHALRTHWNHKDDKKNVKLVLDSNDKFYVEIRVKEWLSLVSRRFDQAVHD
jgi:hypothetical protein